MAVASMPLMDDAMSSPDQLAIDSDLANAVPSSARTMNRPTVPMRLKAVGAAAPAPGRKPKKPSGSDAPECRFCRKSRTAAGPDSAECRFCRKSSGRSRATTSVKPGVKPGASRGARLVARIAASHQHRNGRWTPGKSPDADIAVVSDPESPPPDFVDISPPPPNLTAVMAHQQVIHAFLSVQPPPSATAPHLNWLVETSGLPKMSSVMHMSTLAFCGAKLGRASPSGAHLVQASRQWYATGLRELQKALWDPKQMYKDDTLAACVLLAMYELAECPTQSRKGYKSHHDGCAMLVKARGPSAHSTGLARAVFSTFRIMGASEGLANRETFLATPEWMDLPFRLRQKNPLDKLVDLMLEIPAILRLVDDVKARTTPRDQFEGGIELLKVSLALATRFCDFYTDFEANSPELYWTIDRPIGSPLEDANPFETQFEFPNLEVAATLLHYWASRVMLLSIMCLVHRSMIGYKDAVLKYKQAEKPDSPEATQSPHWAEIFDMPVSDSMLAVKNAVRYVCQSVEFCLAQTGRWAGGNAVMAPLRIVLDTTGRWPEFQRETKYILRALERVHEQGMAIVPFLGQIRTGYKG